MVVFTCNYCGDSLQKPTVEKHYNFSRCPKHKNLTCVDCLKDFRGEEFATHTKCISESARYSAKGEQVEGMKKGEVKQESWMEMIEKIMREDPDIKFAKKEICQIISNNPNVPRKKPRFINFLKSATANRVSLKDMEYVWNIIEKYKTQNEAQKSKVEEAKKSGTQENGDKSNGGTQENGDKLNGLTKNDKENKNKKRKAEDEDDEESVTKKSKNIKINDEETEASSFDFPEKILKILQKKKSISLEKLQKKVVNAYLKHQNLTEETPKIIKKFNKKLKKVEEIKVEDDNVILVEN